MRIQSYFFGTQDVDPDTIIEFPDGLVGLEHCKRFKLFHNIETKKDASAMYWLQSLDEEGIALPVVEPSGFGFSYEFQLNDAEQAQLKIEQPDDAAILLILYREPNMKDNPFPFNRFINANINAPLVINVTARLGLQKIINTASYKVHIQDK